MSMFKRMLASAGIGAAKVDLMLHQDVVNAGDTISGVVRIQGGRVEQQVDDVYAFVKTHYLKDDPHPYSAIILDAMHQLGFRLREVTCEYAPRYSKINGLDFVQEFEFVPAAQFRTHLDELEIIFLPDEYGIGLVLQIDRKVRGLAGLFADALDSDESFVKVRFDHNQLASGVDYVADQLLETIRKYV